MQDLECIKDRNKRATRRHMDRLKRDRREAKVYGTVEAAAREQRHFGTDRDADHLRGAYEV